MGHKSPWARPQRGLTGLGTLNVPTCLQGHSFGICTDLVRNYCYTLPHPKYIALSYDAASTKKKPIDSCQNLNVVFQRGLTLVLQ